MREKTVAECLVYTFFVNEKKNGRGATTTAPSYRTYYLSIPGWCFCYLMHFLSLFHPAIVIKYISLFCTLAIFDGGDGNCVDRGAAATGYRFFLSNIFAAVFVFSFHPGTFFSPFVCTIQ